MSPILPRIFTVHDLRTTWAVEGNTLWKRLSYQLKVGGVRKLRRGLYARGDVAVPLTKSDARAAACLAFAPAYVSGYDVLRQAGVISQDDGAAWIATAKRRDVVIGGHTVRALKIPPAWLSDPWGVAPDTDGTPTASPERALADVLTVSPLAHLDRPSVLRKKLLVEAAERIRPFSPRAADRLAKISQLARR